MDEIIRRFAEDPDSYLPDPSPPARRIMDERFVLFLGPTTHLNLVSSIVVAPEDVESVVEEIRAHAQPERRRVGWVIGPSCRPPDLEQRLLALGFEPATRPPYEPAATAMALTEPPDFGATEHVEVRLVVSRPDYVMSDEIMSAGFGIPDDEHADLMKAVDERYAAYAARDDYLRFLALVDGEPVAAAGANAGSLGLFLGGAATVVAARGRGAYRALVRARWDEAVRRGTPALVIQAGAMSEPILARLGFERVCELSVLLDPLTGA